MAITFEVRPDPPADVDALVVPAVEGRPAGHGLDGDHLRFVGFTGEAGEVVTLPAGPGRAVVVVGLGPGEGVGVPALRRAAAVAVRAAAPFARVASHLLDALPTGTDPALRARAARAIAEGSVLGAYRYDRYRSSAEQPALAHLVVVGPPEAQLARAVADGARLAGAVGLARDLVNEPGGSLTPVALAERAVDIAERVGLEAAVLDERDLAARGMGGLLGVSRGSAQPPRLIQLTYQPAGADPAHLAVVGKGITFDSGGLSIKSADGMMTMKDDMAGGAAVLGAMSVLPAVAPGCRVSAYIPASDNMTGPDATRPGDVLRIYGGRTVEVLNTDAEGRLVLADALVLASEARPDAIVDLATLTGAVVTALGHGIAGLLGSHEGWVQQVRDAADRAGERVWPLPLPGDYRKRLDSDIADLRNIGREKGAGALVGGLFLREFVGDIPWAHLDIAGPAWSDAVDGEVVKGGTGFGVLLLAELARTFRPPG